MEPELENKIVSLIVEKISHKTKDEQLSGIGYELLQARVKVLLAEYF